MATKMSTNSKQGNINKGSTRSNGNTYQHKAKQGKINGTLMSSSIEYSQTQNQGSILEGNMYMDQMAQQADL